MMELNNKEQKIKEALSTPIFEVDNDLLWNDISQHLNKPKRKNRLWFIPLLGSSLSLFLVVAYFGLTAADQFDSSNQLAINTGIQDHSIVEKPTTNTLINKLEDKQNFVDNNNGKNEKSNIQTKNSNTENKTKKSNSESLTIQNNKTKTTSQSAVTTISAPILIDKKAFQNSNEIVKQSKIVSTSKEKKEINTSSGFNRQLNNEADPILSKIYDDSQNGIIETFDPISTLFINKQIKKEDDIAQDLTARIDVLNGNKTQFFFQVQSGVSQAFQTIKLTNNEISEFPLLSKESALPSYTFNAKVGILNRSQWKFFTGVRLTNMVFKYENIEQYSNQTTEDGTVYDYLQEDGSLLAVQGEISQQNINNHQIQWHRQHRQIHLELGLAKKIISVNRFSITPDASILYNINSRHTGYYFDQDEAVIQKFTSKEINPYVNTTSLQFQSGLTLEYSLRKLDLGLAANYVNSPNSITNNNHFYESKNSQLGLQFSITVWPGRERIN